MTPVGIETKTFATRARARNHCTMECLPRLGRCLSLGGERGFWKVGRKGWKSTFGF